MRGAGENRRRERKIVDVLFNDGISKVNYSVKL